MAENPTNFNPDELAQEFLENQSLISLLRVGGDDLTKLRQVDHWIYFSNVNDRDSFKKIILTEGYKLEEEDRLDNNPARPFKLHISKVDRVDIESISKTTLDLKNKAKQMNGKYDGWETDVVK